MKKVVLTIRILLLVLLVGVSGCTSNKSETNSNNPKIEGVSDNKVIIFKDPNCGCCAGYATYLGENGFEVDVKASHKDLSSIKERYNIPLNMQSCHTAVIGDYFVEGHVPIEAVKKLLLEKPDIDGIALPGMPSGSPGMPGPKRQPFKIHTLVDGKSSEFMLI